MLFPSPLKPANLMKRYKRFLADVQLPNKEIITIHCANTGAMTGCANENDVVWYSTSNNTKRKLPCSWELTHTKDNYWICINTIRANTIVKEALANKKISELYQYDNIKSEVKYGTENSRIDLLLSDNNDNQCYVEVKSVTLHNPINQFGYFPDAVTHRGQKHLRELMEMVKKGSQSVIFFLVMHSGIKYFSPAEEIDPDYANLLKQAKQSGVKILCYNTIISTNSIEINHPIPIIID